MTEAAQNDEMEEIIQDFIIESTELLDGLDQQLIDLEKTPDDQDLLNAIFRSVHTIKGAAGFLAFNQIVDVAHITEGVLNKLRQGELRATPAIMDAILNAVDMLKVLMSHVKAKDGKEEDLSQVLAALQDIDVSAEKANDEAGKGKEDIATPVERQDEGGTQASGQESSQQKILKEDSETIRVDIKRLDSVLNMVGELVLGRNRLMRLSAQLEDRYGEEELVTFIKQTTYNLNLITTDLQLSVMKTRMQPVSKIFSRFPRMVRDLARKNGKEIDLVLEGEETEMDKTIIEEIGDPLVHLVRNAIDHGLEGPEERKSAGKSAAGTLTLSAYHKGNNIFIAIKDDGRGMDINRIKSKAMEKGIATFDDMERMSEKEILNFIFHPGFSTASEVTDISGRGVGMDVVKSNIAKLNGSIDIETSRGNGSEIELRLPLTLAIINVLMVGVGDETYAIPLSTVIEIKRLEGHEIKTMDGREVVYSRNIIYPLIRLSDLIGAGSAGQNAYVVIIAFGEKQIAVLVDSLLGQEEVVIKSMGEYLSDTAGISGATITGDGKVVLIIDVMGLSVGMERMVMQ